MFQMNFDVVGRFVCRVSPQPLPTRGLILSPMEVLNTPSWQLTPWLQIPMAQTPRFTSDGFKRDSNGRWAGKVLFALDLKQRAASCAVCFNYSFPYCTVWAGAAAPPSVRGASRDGCSSTLAARGSASTCAWGAFCMGSGQGEGSGSGWGRQLCVSCPLRGHSVVSAGLWVLLIELQGVE